MNAKNISLEKKVNLVFTYLFDDATAEKEADFWNKLNTEEISELKDAQKENALPFESLKKTICLLSLDSRDKIYKQ